MPAQTATQANIDRRRPLSAYSTEEYRDLHARFLARRQVPLLISSSHVRDMTRLADLIEKEGTVIPIDWLTQRRIERAKALLADTTLSIRKVANSVGFRTAMFFARTFKLQTGVSPTDWRRTGR